MMLRCRGPINHPSRAAFRFKLRTMHGTYDLRVDEAPFCAIQRDGWMNPWWQERTATVLLEDPRLSEPMSNRSNHG